MIFFYILLALIAFTLLLASRQPDKFTVTRSLFIKAAPEVIFPFANDHRMSGQWSPWLKIDPQAVSTFAGPGAGVGASTSWEGRKIGKGTATIIESHPYSLIRTRLEFLKPFKATNISDFILTPVSGGTEVTWRMEGDNTMMSKIMGLLINCDKMCGSAFEDGLSNLKKLVEL